MDIPHTRWQALYTAQCVDGAQTRLWACLSWPESVVPGCPYGLWSLQHGLSVSTGLGSLVKMFCCVDRVGGPGCSSETREEGQRLLARTLMSWPRSAGSGWASAPRAAVSSGQGSRSSVPSPCFTPAKATCRDGTEASCVGGEKQVHSYHPPQHCLSQPSR